jgi:predicted regulator of Ras-like GTPase activity (Roadblock/LC7/MglB family)/predicted Zn-dependent protease
MNGPAAADLQRWSAEVARDPTSPAFVPLARAFRRQGRRDAALRLCLRGLEHNPSHVEAHLLLALLCLDVGDRDRACDEWAIVLRLEPERFEANRGMGFYYLERGDYGRARRHLERAAATRPEEPAVREALALLRDRAPAAAAPPPRALAEPPFRPAAGAPAPAVTAPPPTTRVPRDPGRLFEPMLADPPFIGAMVIDMQGLVVAGSTREGSGVEALGAVLAAAIDEAVRTAHHLALGDWRSILLEAEQAVVHMSPLTAQLALLLAVRREAPTGWVLRTAARAQGLARAFLGADA